MLRVITGRFHPHLETALVDHLRQAKAADPLAPIAVLVPSGPLRDRVQRLLAVGHRLSLLNLHCLTFHQFALRLADEGRRLHRRTTLRVVDDLFFEQLVRHLVRTRLSRLTPLQQLGDSPGSWGALWSTIRDLKDAGVNPAAALRGLSEGYFEKDDAAWLEALFALHAAVKEVGNTFEVGTADDLAESLIPFVAASPFVSSLAQVVYYGFYDLTQVQLSLFEAVSHTAPTTLFFPLEDNPSFGFARRFFDRYIQPRVTAPENLLHLPDLAHSRPPQSIALSVRSVIGVEEELASTCRTILDLVETHAYRIDEIGVVARTLDPYRGQLQSVFGRHRIPFTTTATRPLMQEPLCKLLLQMASLPVQDFYRTTVLDVVTSPLYHTAVCDRQRAAYRPEQWKQIMAALQITRGMDEWKRVEVASQSALTLGGADGESDVLTDLNIAPDVTALLWVVLSDLFADCARLPTRGTIGQLVEACRGLIDRHLARPIQNPASNENSRARSLEAVWETIDGLWVRLRELDTIDMELSWPEFVELLTHALDRTAAPINRASHQGVAVLDVMAARGVPFKALFVLGLNEKVFPRYIREDAFLRDRHRLVLDTTLGFKIDGKLVGYEEEALLFRQLCQSASHRLYLSYQRGDDAGRMLAASPYLGDTAQRLGVESQPVEVIPRRLTDRVRERPTLRMFLPPAKLAQWMATTGEDPTELIHATGRDADTFYHAAEALGRMEEDGRSLNPFDGMTGTLTAHWSRVAQRGMAPTPLERYARCPFQYFAADVLRLETIRLPVHNGPDAALLGMLCHAALRRCYAQLVQMGWPAMSIPMEQSTQLARIAVEEAATGCETTHRTGHYLLWELAKEQIATLILAAIQSDEVAQGEEPYTPIAFEVDTEGTIPMTANGRPTLFKIHGRLDRVDRQRHSGAVRVIDYKFKTGQAIKPEDRNLLQSAVRGYRLQPPLYASMFVGDGLRPSQVQFYFLAPHWPQSITKSTFESPAWSSDIGIRIQKTLESLLDGIRQGRYFILPDSYCEACEFRVVCRREHTPTWWRAHRADDAHALKLLRAERVKEG